MKRIAIIFIGILLLTVSCQKSDICIESEPSTPRLVIKFMDEDRPARTKAVEGFNAKAKDSDFYYSSAITDTIAMLPLLTTNDSTTYEFFIHQGDSLKTESVTVKFAYSSEDQYISRACGFRDRFENLEATLENNQWIKNITIPDSISIKDEKNTHLYIYH